MSRDHERARWRFVESGEVSRLGDQAVVRRAIERHAHEFGAASTRVRVPLTSSAQFRWKSLRPLR